MKIDSRFAVALLPLLALLGAGVLLLKIRSENGGHVVVAPRDDAVELPSPSSGGTGEALPSEAAPTPEKPDGEDPPAAERDDRAGSTEPEPAGETSKPGAGLMGKVVDVEGRPVGGAKVTLLRPARTIMDTFHGFSNSAQLRKLEWLVRSPDTVVSENVTSALGEFRFRDDVAEGKGPYNLRATAPGYAAGFRPEVRFGTDHRPLILVLREEAYLSGWVFSAPGEALEGSVVVAIREVEGSPMRRWPYMEKTWVESLEGGRFHFASLATGRYTLVAMHERFLPAIRKGVTVPGPEVRMNLPTGLALEGRVFMGNSADPITTAIVYAWSMEGAGRFKSGVDEEGRYRLDGLPPGSYFLVVIARGAKTEQVKVAGKDGEVVRQDLRVTVAGTKVSGSVLDGTTGRPLEGVVVQASLGEFKIGIDKTGADGVFTLHFDLSREKEAVEDSISADKEGWEQKERTLLKIEPPFRDVTSIEILMYEVPRGSGWILDPSGRPLPGATVQTDRVGKDETTDEKGAFQVLLQSGKGFILARHPNFAPGLHAFENLAPGEKLKGLVIRLPKGGAIEVLLRDESGQPVAKEWVVLSYVFPGEENPFEGPGPFRFEVAASMPGPIRHANLRPGTWLVHVESKKYYHEELRPVQVTNGSTAEVTITLMQGRAIEGKVVDGKGKPVQYVELTAFSSGTRKRHKARSGEDGTFRLGGLRPGTYRLFARVPGESEAFFAKKIEAGTKGLRIVYGE